MFAAVVLKYGLYMYIHVVLPGLLELGCAPCTGLDSQAMLGAKPSRTHVQSNSLYSYN